MSHRFGPRTRLSSLANSRLVSQWLRQSNIKSVQRGTITIAGASTSNTAAITSVVLANSKINFLGCTVAGNEAPDFAFARVALTNATTVTATKGNGLGGSDDVVVSYEVIEYVTGIIRSVQRGTITCAAGSATAAITSVNTAKTELTFLGYSTVNIGANNTWLPWIDLTNATTVTATSTAADATVGYQAIEWW